MNNFPSYPTAVEIVTWLCALFASDLPIPTTHSLNGSEKSRNRKLKLIKTEFIPVNERTEVNERINKILGEKIIKLVNVLSQTNRLWEIKIPTDHKLFLA